MNSLERFVYDKLKGSPALKQKVRQLYQIGFDLIPTRHLKTPFDLYVHEGFFFGFHDHTPFSADNSKLLTNRFYIPLRMPQPDDKLEVGYLSGVGYKEYTPVSETRAWNWHQGCKLQWCGSSGTLVFNDHQDGTNIARMIDVDTGSETVLPVNISSVSGEGRWGVGYSFERVERYMPGYGYVHTAGEPELSSQRPKRSGLNIINLDNATSSTVFSIDDIAQVQPDQSMEGAYHYFSHALFSPSSLRLVFLHRWMKDDVRNRKSRLISCDINGEDLHIFPTSGMVSHFSWRDDQHVLAYCSTETFGDSYMLFEDQSDGVGRPVGENLLRSDGHPSYSPDKRWIITDTYPDRMRHQHLLLYDCVEEKLYRIARFKLPKPYSSPNPYRHWQCDLHPRWDRTGRYICVDTAYTGQRALTIIDLQSAELQNV